MALWVRIWSAFLHLRDKRKCFFFLYIFLVFLGLYPRHVDVPRLGVESKPQSWPHQIRATSSICAAAYGNGGSLTHWVRLGIKPSQILNPLSHNRNSSAFCLGRIFFFFLNQQLGRPVVFKARYLKGIPQSRKKKLYSLRQAFVGIFSFFCHPFLTPPTVVSQAFLV